MKRLFTIILMLLIFAYPFAIYFGLDYFEPKYLALLIAFIFLLRFITISSRIKSTANSSLFLITAAGIGTNLLGAISNQDLIMKLYPVIINLLMFGIFFYSILYPPTVIERLVRIKSPDLPEEAVEYITKVTLIWCGFFIINGAISLWTALFATVKIWVFYNGFLSYIFIGVLFVTEFTYRQWAKRKNCLSKC